MRKILSFALVVCAACSGASPLAPVKPAAPVISDVNVAAVTPSSARLTWVTDKESDSQAEFGTTSSYGSMSTADTQPVTSHTVNIEGLEQGTAYHYRVRSRDKDGTLALSENLTFTTPQVDSSGEDDSALEKRPRPTSPVAAVTRPVSGATVSGTITVTATATDDVGVVGVQFKRNGSNLGAEDRTAPYSIEWNTTSAANGSHTITAVARDSKRNSTTSAAVTVVVSNGVSSGSDTTPPAVSIGAPAGGATASGTITVTANASDNVGVAGVQFKVDGVNVGDEDTGAPYSIQWNTTGVANGSRSITAVARDGAGNATTSASVSVTVSNNTGNPDTTAPSVSISTPAGGSTASGTITVTANASDNVGVAGVQFKADGVNIGDEDTGAPYSIQWNTTGTANGSRSITAFARDGAGNTTTSASVSVTVSNNPGNPDTTAPSVSISAPAGGSTASGTIAVTANASDNIGVAGVQFKVDGANLGVEDVTAPYSVQWNTGTVSNGSHTVLAVARDAAGNSTTSTSVAVTVTNDQAPPAVSITAPAVGATLSGTRTVSATASDDVGVAGVQFKLNGINLGIEDTTSPYSVSWNTTNAANGPHTLTATARDGAGNTTTSAGVAVIVANVSVPPPGGGTWPNQPAGYTTLSDQPWGALSSLGWNHQNRGASSFISADASAPLSSASVLAHSYPVGMQGGVEPAVDWYSLPANFTEGYVGMWWKPSSNFQNHPSNVNKIFFIFGSAGHIIPVMYGTGGGSFQLRMAPEWGGWSWLTPNVGSGNITLGQWHRIEVYFKQQTSGGIIRWWMDGNLIGNYTNVSFPSSMQFQELQIAPTWGGVGGTKSHQDYFWFDHVHLSRP